MAEAKNHYIKDILKLILFLGIGFFFVYWFLLKLDGDTKSAIWESVTGANYWWIAVAMAVNTIALLMRALRWRILYEPLGYRPSANNTFGSVVITYLANLAFPRLGDVLRCGTMRTSEGIEIEKSLGTVVTERIVDIVSYLLILLIGVAVMFADMKDWFGSDLAAKFANWPMMAAMLCSGIALAVIMVWCYSHFRKKWISNKLFAKIDKLITGCWDGFKSIVYLKRGSILLFIIYSVLLYLCYVVGGLVTFYAFPETAGLGMKEACVVYLFGSMGMLISQGGLGAYPALVQKALLIYGVPLAAGTACGWVMWSAMQVMTIVLGLVYSIYFSLKKNNPKQNK